MNEETFLAGLRDLGEIPVPGPLPEQQVIARGRVARRRRAAVRTATAAAGTVLAVAAVVAVPSGYFTALPSRTPAPLTNGDTIVSQWPTTVGALAGDASLGTALRARARQVLPGRPTDARVLVATDLDRARVALVAGLRRAGGYETAWLVGPRGAAPDRLQPWTCSGLLLCIVPVRADGSPGEAPPGGGPVEQLGGPPPEEVPVEYVGATLVGATVTARASDVDDTGHAVAVPVPVEDAGTAGLFRVVDLPSGPFQVVARRGGGTASAAVGPSGPNPDAAVEDLYVRLRDPSLRGSGGLAERRPGAADQRAVRALVAAVVRATGLPQEGTCQPLYAAGRGGRQVVVLAVQSPSEGWVVVPADIAQPRGAEPSVALEALITTPPGGPSVRGFAWRSRSEGGRLRWDGAAPDRVAVLGPRGADAAEVTGTAGTVRLRLDDGYAEAVVPGASRVRFLGDHGVVVAETEVAPLLPPGGTLLPR